MLSIPSVHVTMANLPRHGDRVGKGWAWLSPEEQERAQRFRQEADRIRFVLGRMMARQYCARHLGVKPAQIVFDATSEGKLWLPAYPKFCFNVSHSGDWILFAWSEHAPVGVDVEAMDRRIGVPLEKMAESAFSPTECQALVADRHALADTFFRIWVRKEAIIKAEGCGLGGRLHDFSVAHLHHGMVQWRSEVVYPDSPSPWRIHEIAVAPGYQAAIAAAPSCELRQENWILDEARSAPA